MNEVLKRALDKVTAVDLWIALGFLAAGGMLWLLIGRTKKSGPKLRRHQVGAALVLALLAAGAVAANHLIFIRELVFAKNVTGILVLRLVGDDARDSLQGDLVEHLNAGLQREPAGEQMQVLAGTESIDENRNPSEAHKRARAVGERANAQLVIWGRKVGENRLLPRVTIVAAPEKWPVAGEPERGLHDIAELRLPPITADEPLYLVRLAVGYHFCHRGNYGEALSHFDAALRRAGASSDELADLQFLAAFCHQRRGAEEKAMSRHFEKAIELYQSAADAYENTDPELWARTQNNLGIAYADLPAGDREGNRQKAIAAHEAALRVYNERDFPLDWATTQANLTMAATTLPTDEDLQKAVTTSEAALSATMEKDSPLAWAAKQTDLADAYANLPTGDRAENLQKTIAAYEAALRVYNEKDFPLDWAMTQTNLANALTKLPASNRTGNLQKAIAAYELALRVCTEKEFPVEWAANQNNLATAYTELIAGNRAGNLRKAIAAYKAALRVCTDKEFPLDWATTQYNLGTAFTKLPGDNRAGDLQVAINAFQAALRVYNEDNSPVEWAMTQTNLGAAYAGLRKGNRAGNLQKAITAFEAALRVYNEEDFPVEWASTQHNLGLLHTEQTTGSRTGNLKKAKIYFEAALRVWSEDKFPEHHRDAAKALIDVQQKLRSLTAN